MRTRAPTMTNFSDNEKRVLGKSWYHPRLKPEDADFLLREGKDGSFLVRPTHAKDRGHPGDHICVLCVRVDTAMGPKYFSFPIINVGAGHTAKYKLKGAQNKVTARTIPELLVYYTRHSIIPEKNKQSQVTLRHCINSLDLVKERWYHGNISPEEAKDLLGKYGKRGSFLVRESFFHPVQEEKPTEGERYTISVRTSKKRERCEVHHIPVMTKPSGEFYVFGNKQDHWPQMVDLVAFLNGKNFTMGNGGKVSFKHPLHCKVMTASELKKRLDVLEKCAPGTTQTGFLEEFMLLQELSKAQDGQEFSKNICMLPQNRQQNRFKNILPYDHSLVKLTDGGRDYINANLIQGSKIDEDIAQQYIATQGPLAHTMEDFWRLVLQENIRVISMTTKVVERGKNKCSKYWADDVKPLLEFPTNNGTIYVKHAGPPLDLGMYQIRHLQVWRDGTGPCHQAPRDVYQFHFIAWPDFGVPKNPGMMLQYLRDLKIKYHEIQKQLVRERKKPIGPLLIHCSAGIGRTGTVIVLDILIQQIILRGIHCALNIFEVVQKLRLQREGMIQTDPQYKFLYIAMEHYVGTMSQRHKPNPNDNQGQATEYENLYSMGNQNGFKPVPARRPPPPQPKRV